MRPQAADTTRGSEIAIDSRLNGQAAAACMRASLAEQR